MRYYSTTHCLNCGHQLSAWESAHAHWCPYCGIKGTFCGCMLETVTIRHQVQPTLMGFLMWVMGRPQPRTK